ncbi:hypothetical protein CAOG_01791 [Capsaspora owczarzaki ATCC 30864]|uniref:Uncharacterized protein n=1 Tax=Capsaspora owczarzaki (strain ATCC 30864) TaxID=595528 RepID=A0A0D2WJZ8_CAPO3|nr:hypothetical protein CAOG_01791 [Capsaspora owczarzaki ATCC 30864]KJE90480.1 hypothetical protein CAOG_001791 [Capsaspora owczarzaki ATCC 30864]|eukprot:XP_004364659.1 hypothetical protein CAOG_01791 [Capsaspora owczarzaki ATCC 30864]
MLSVNGVGVAGDADPEQQQQQAFPPLLLPPVLASSSATAAPAATAQTDPMPLQYHFNHSAAFDPDHDGHDPAAAASTPSTSAGFPATAAAAVAAAAAGSAAPPQHPSASSSTSSSSLGLSRQSSATQHAPLSGSPTEPTSGFTTPAYQYNHTEFAPHTHSSLGFGQHHHSFSIVVPPSNLGGVSPLPLSPALPIITNGAPYDSSPGSFTERRRSVSVSSQHSPMLSYRSLSRSPPVSGPSTPTRRLSMSAQNRVIQLQREDSLGEAINRELTHERDTTHSLSLSQSCEDLHLEHVAASLRIPPASPTLSPRAPIHSSRSQTPNLIASPHRIRATSPSPLSSNGGPIKPASVVKHVEPYISPASINKRLSMNFRQRAVSESSVSDYDAQLMLAQRHFSAFVSPTPAAEVDMNGGHDPSSSSSSTMPSQTLLLLSGGGDGYSHLDPNEPAADDSASMPSRVLLP